MGMVLIHQWVWGTYFQTNAWHLLVNSTKSFWSVVPRMPSESMLDSFWIFCSKILWHYHACDSLKQGPITIRWSSWSFLLWPSWQLVSQLHPVLPSLQSRKDACGGYVWPHGYVLKQSKTWKERFVNMCKNIAQNGLVTIRSQSMSNKICATCARYRCGRSQKPSESMSLILLYMLYPFMWSLWHPPSFFFDDKVFDGSVAIMGSWDSLRYSWQLLGTWKRSRRVHRVHHWMMGWWDSLPMSTIFRGNSGWWWERKHMKAYESSERSRKIKDQQTPLQQRVDLMVSSKPSQPWP